MDFANFSCISPSLFTCLHGYDNGDLQRKLQTLGGLTVQIQCVNKALEMHWEINNHIGTEMLDN